MEYADRRGPGNARIHVPPPWRAVKAAPRLLRIPENGFPIIAIFDVMNCIEAFGNGTGSIYNSRRLSPRPE
ncbi:hypothetical protein [Burkholderia territorii]|uniref:hypothetical protein n=1 Tax=Burkholderia territorii TaxID=1503055 RepID=UPI001478167A|nr:hypothetical protein [Burkholderia territorii]MBM2773116.1 hypothetical protein [Burkholderia territorii]